MAKSPPSDADLKTDFGAGVGAKAQKWERNTLKATGVADAARSDAAESTYQAKMQAVLANRQRQKGLANVSDEDIKAGVRQVGGAGWSSATTRKADKFVKKARKYVDAAIDEANKLPPRTADPIANVDARVKPIVARLAALKRGGA